MVDITTPVAATKHTTINTPGENKINPNIPALVLNPGKDGMAGMAFSIPE